MSLNADQLTAVECDTNCLVVACPGSGKTHLVVEKIVSILQRDSSARIVAVTFTRDGAKELMHRVERRLGGKTERVFVSTFHSLALSHLKKNKIRIHIASNAEVTSTVKRAIDTLGMNISIASAQACIESCKTIPHYEPMNDPAGQLYTTYQTICKRNGVQDFFDVMQISLDMIREGSLPILGATHMIVDEFQDVDEVQFQYMMEHYRTGKVVVTAVGDDDQTIFSFRHALGYEGMKRFESETKAVRVTLGINYRCHREILSAADRLINFNQNRLDKRLFAHKGRGGKVSNLRCGDSWDEAHAATDMILNTAKSTVVDGRRVFDIKPNEWAILSRNNILLDDVEGALRSVGIPYYRSGTSFWDRSVPSLMLTVLKSMVKKERAGIEHLLHWSGISIEDIDLLRELIGDDWLSVYDIKLMTSLDLSIFTTTSKDVIQELVIKIAGQAKRANKSGDEDVLRVIKGLADGMRCRTNSISEIRCIDIVQSALSSMTGTLLERINRVQEKIDKKDSGGVALTTMHSSKGLEFDNVWIVGAESSVIPSTREGMPTSAEIEEERKLMYVAMTRARNTLFVSSSGSQESQFLGEAQIPQSVIPPQKKSA